MKRVKQAICLILCMAIGITLLIGCNKDETPNAPSQSPSSSQSPASSPSPSNSSTGNSPSVPTSMPSAEEPPPPETEYYDHLTLLINDKIAVIDLFNTAVASSQLAFITQNVYNRLIKRTAEGEFVPELAVSWDTDDYTTFNFKLRNDVYFHNGEKFTANDVAFTIDQAKQSPGTGMYDRYVRVESYEVVGDYEINLTLQDVNVDFLFDVSASTGGILNEKAYNDDSEKGPWVGTGPWIVTGHVVNESIQYARNDNYWGQIPVTKTMTMRYIAEETAKLIMIENDEADITNLDSAYIPMYENDDSFMLWGYTMDNTNIITFNLNNPLLADVNFRKAVAHAFKPEDCVAISINGYGVALPSGTFWGGATEFRNSDIPKFEYNLDLAREYLAKTSYHGEDIEAVAAMPHIIKNAQVLQENLKQIGINIVIFETDGPTSASYTVWGNTESQIVVGSSVWGGKASSCRSYLYPGYNANKANYDNPRVNELIDRGSTTFDRAEREKIYKEIQEIIAEEVIYIPVFNMSLYYIGQLGCGGMVWYPDNNHDFSQAYRIKQP